MSDEKPKSCRCGHARSSHGHEFRRDRCGNTACRHERCNCFAFRPRVSALKPQPCHCGKLRLFPTETRGDWQVKCYTCFAEGPVCRTMREAILAWNEERDTAGKPGRKRDGEGSEG